MKMNWLRAFLLSFTFFVPSSEVDPENGVLYMVSGKIVSINAQTTVGANYDWNNYDMMPKWCVY
jgi:hypothetical protein